MTGRNKFSSLKTRIGADRLAQVEAKTKTMLAEMLLPEIRKHSGMTQKEVAAVLGISQPGLSKIENQEDMHIGTGLNDEGTDECQGNAKRALVPHEFSVPPCHYTVLVGQYSLCS